MSNKKRNWEWINACREDRPKVQKYDSYWDLPPLSISYPIKGAAGKTGNWRTFRPVVNHEVCIKCYQCYMYCPEGVIGIDQESGQVTIDYDYCKGCSVCANNCPKHCIEMVKETK